MARALMLIAAEEERLRRCERIQRKILRDSSLPMMLPEESFVAHFRLTKAEFVRLCDELQPFLSQSRRSTAVHPETKILAALQFFGNGNYQRSLGSHYELGLAQKTVSKCLTEVVNALNRPEVLRKYIKFPRTRQERLEVTRGFMEKFQFPGVLGCIDGTHVAIVRPKDNEEAYFNRKLFHSLNVLVICDSDLRIIHCDASFGGASHDSHVWNSSPVKREMENLHDANEGHYLLGDSGYAQRPWMMTPILNTAPNTPEAYYTARHVRTRNVVERLFGVLKSRFRCLLAHRVLHYDPVKAGKIFNACAVLHNLIGDKKFPPTQELADDAHAQPPVAIVRDNSDSGRPAVVSRLWTNRSRR